MSYSRGDIVLINIRFVSGTGSKVRPALIVQSDHNNSRIGNTILVTVTRTVSRIHEPTQLLVDPATPEGQPSGLLAPSAVTCENIFTVEQQHILRKIGELPDSLMDQVNVCLKASLGIS